MSINQQRKNYESQIRNSNKMRALSKQPGSSSNLISDASVVQLNHSYSRMLETPGNYSQQNGNRHKQLPAI